MGGHRFASAFAVVASVIGNSAAVGGEPVHRTSTSEMGSLLVFSNLEARFAGDDFELVHDTFVTLYNDSPQPVRLLCHMINGDSPLEEDPISGERAHPGYNFFDFTIELGPNQPTYWSAFRGQPAVNGVPPLNALDPGYPPARPDPEGGPDRVVRGMLYMWATDDDNSPIIFNHLSGAATSVDYERHTAAEWKAHAFRKLAPSAPPAPTHFTERIWLDGVDYAAPFAELLLDFQAVGSSAFEGPIPVVSGSRLVLHPAGRDLRGVCGPITTQAQICVWNQNEIKFLGTRRCITGWDSTALADYDAPNSFLRAILQTDHGFARIDGVASPECDIDANPENGAFPGDDPCEPSGGEDGLPPGDPNDVISEPAALLGVITRTLTFDASVQAQSGTTLRGEGVEPTAALPYVRQSPPPFTTPSSAGAPGGEEDDAAGAGPASVAQRIDTSRKGSLLVFPNVELRWSDATGALIQDTFITLQNTFPDAVTVKLRYVNGDPPLDAAGGEPAHPGWNDVPATLALTGSQPTYWSAASGLPGAAIGLVPFTALDPGTPPGRIDPARPGERVLRGAIYAWAVDDGGAEIRWNHLAGGAAIVRYDDQTTWDYNALAVPVVDDAIAHGAPTGTAGVLMLDGTEYGQGFDQLRLDFPAVGGDAFSRSESVISTPLQVTSTTDLTLHPLTLNLAVPTDRPVTTAVQITVWNQNAVQFAVPARCVTCWDRSALEDLDTAFQVDMLQTERGWARLDGVASAACDIDFDPFDGLPFPPGPGDPADPRDVVSEDASLVGVRSDRFAFETAAVDTIGSVLTGLGVHPATVAVDADAAVAGACCVATACAVVAPDQCLATGGVFGGPDTSCSPNPCLGSPGACCLVNGVCIPAEIIGCSSIGGQWQGVGSVCGAVTCASPTGACCLGEACQETTLLACASSGGSFQGPGTTCAACAPAQGACCLYGGSCDVRAALDCNAATGVYQGDGTTCGDVTCPAPPAIGACCFEGGACDTIAAAACTSSGGTYEGDGTACAATTCPAFPPVGACCAASGVCAFTVQSVCLQSGGAWLGAGTNCANDPCPAPAGACCFGTACAVVTPLECLIGGGAYLGTGSTCDATVACSAPVLGDTASGRVRDVRPARREPTLNGRPGPDLRSSFDVRGPMGSEPARD